MNPTPKKSPRRIIAQPYDFSVQDLVDKIISKDIELNPDYQRNYVWEANDETENKKSRLIESLLLNIPIPVIYFAELQETLKYEVIDGQQRLQTFLDFLNDKFELKNLEIRDDVNKLKYSQLVQKDKDEIRKRSIRAIVILNESDEEIKYEVFERLNLGSVQLTSQEIRNNTLRGSFNDLLKELAKEEKFLNLINLKLKKDQNNMAKEELVLRFFAYHFNDWKRAESLSYFLTKYMKENQHMSQVKIESHRKLFHDTLSLVENYLGKNAFSIYQVSSFRWNPSTNRALFDAVMLAFAKVKEKEIKLTPNEVIDEMKKLMENEEFQRSLIAQSGGKKIEKRVNSVINILLNNYDII
ncbi:GmrSD restriction endonuclease domain-containing protein [Leptospira interrogans]|uniref:PF03235 family protein n=1 Tax=Leptospira interrogans serovar Zanoni str. LT2156 TaxID=1001601 RepID=M6I3D8_LEPIR|nr:DUF262 domain-containing protein [Leptospira interrogans]EMM97681.1 PF03235 family protein [Leptospira interrogans serovar Zanoni str. LT2156]AKH76246.1 hypothetical protein BRAT_03725 [Leptospira interrogans serovar Bratislava]EJP15781.1 PF03235 family protein [Leptospira interrogans str. FPW2026]EMN07807.1 PF03235 family protein [Leptospira interrogans serovar Muenchen str. Brem 129]KWV23004.1 hypothetical protein LA733_2900 [Leptospira interrogans]